MLVRRWVGDVRMDSQVMDPENCCGCGCREFGLWGRVVVEVVRRNAGRGVLRRMLHCWGKWCGEVLV